MSHTGILQQGPDAFLVEIKVVMSPKPELILTPGMLQNTAHKFFMVEYNIFVPIERKSKKVDGMIEKGISHVNIWKPINI
jgi:hypothetical protein